MNPASSRCGRPASGSASTSASRFSSASALWLFDGPTHAGQFFAGYLTEYSLSVDNLFVFYIIMTRFAVPKAYQHKVLLVGILIALVMRGIFIALGAAALAQLQLAVLRLRRRS